MESKISEILNEMEDCLTIEQQKKLQQVLIAKLCENRQRTEPIKNFDYQKLFLDAKKIEGCSERTLIYYGTTLTHFFSVVNEPMRKISTDRIREYLAD